MMKKALTGNCLIICKHSLSWIMKSPMWLVCWSLPNYENFLHLSTLEAFVKSNITPFSTMFSKPLMVSTDLYCRRVKAMACWRKG